jgi:hypothetical protein
MTERIDRQLKKISGLTEIRTRQIPRGRVQALPTQEARPCP